MTRTEKNWLLFAGGGGALLVIILLATSETDSVAVISGAVLVCGVALSYVTAVVLNSTDRERQVKRKAQREAERLALSASETRRREVEEAERVSRWAERAVRVREAEGLAAETRAAVARLSGLPQPQPQPRAKRSRKKAAPPTEPATSPLIFKRYRRILDLTTPKPDELTAPKPEDVEKPKRKRKKKD